ncbi:MAG TPA: hypothetical protein VGW12_20795 [Pyrinomonadaceae bacterium]|nr:hypothetical protein [Pyrinomonadaceae bacterium]
MLDWLKELPNTLGLTGQNMIWVLVFSVVTFVLSIAVTVVVLVKLPDTYFKAEHGREFWVERHPVLRWAGLVLKNLLGLVLVLFGVVMSLPGVPGQGVLTILLGIMLLDFPGKRRLELKLVSRPKVLSTINRIRARFERPPLQLDEA